MKWQWLFVAQCAWPVVDSFCDESCNGHGDCGEMDRCNCFDDWTGFNCNLRVCPYGVGWVTRDELDLLDMATPNYPEGLHAYEECSGVGACDRSTGICNCNDGYTGNACRRTTCPNECSGNGICVTNVDVAPEGYGSDGVLRFQKMTWDGRKTSQCLCDPGYDGVDCSIRICPEGFSSADSCNSGEANYHHDVQAITVAFADSFAAMSVADIDMYFSLQFTDAFNSKATTKPISFWDDPQTVQAALYALPSYAVGTVSVSKVWPLQDYTESVDSDSYSSGSRLEEASTFRNLACETWYHDAIASPSCTVDADCADKFGLTAATDVLCESNLKICIETDAANCVVNDAIDEFNTNLCAANFEPDGIYFSTTIGDNFWGRRLGSFERKCNIGLFSTDDTDFAVPCTTNADCVPCAKNTQVTAGECDGVTNTCQPSSTFVTDFVTAELEECTVASFIVSFDTEEGGSRKNLFDCSIGANTNDAGASPKYDSSQLASCGARHIGLSEWRASPFSSTLNDLCWSRDAGTGVATNEFVQTASVAAYEAAGGFCYDFNSETVSDINLVVEDQDVRFAARINDMRDLAWPGTTLFTSSDIANLAVMDYATDLPCSNSGTCFEDTGLCECADGYTGESCALTVEYV